MASSIVSRQDHFSPTSARPKSLNQSGLEQCLPDLEKYIALGSCQMPLESLLNIKRDDDYDGPQKDLSDSQNIHRVLPKIKFWKWSEVTQSVSREKCDLQWMPMSYLCRASWIRVTLRTSPENSKVIRCRVYALPHDICRTSVGRGDVTISRLFMQLVQDLDHSARSWFADVDEPCMPFSTVQQLSQEKGSLFHLFNALNSPQPALAPKLVCPFSQGAIDSILEGSDDLADIKTSLFSYQRRSAAEMLRREVSVRRISDPRLTSMFGPTGAQYFYDNRTGTLLREERFYEAAKGGILAENMGIGKTLICLTLILATKGHWPNIPPEYSLGLNPVRPKVGSLMEMAAAVAGKSNIPWRLEMKDHQSCLKILEENLTSYVVCHEPRKSLRSPVIERKEKIYLCSATLVVVPQNLFAQWRAEIELHLVPNALNVCYLDNDKTPVPSIQDLLHFDILIISRRRFEQEMGVHQSILTYQEEVSPLRELHFLRLIVDEGHDFASSAARNSSFYALKKLRVDRKWVVSGTPSQGLVSADIEQPVSMQDLTQGGSFEREVDLPMASQKKDLEHLGRIVVGFFDLKPWANTTNDDIAPWNWYIMPEDETISPHKSKTLRTILQDLVVRHRAEDFESDISLPPLHHEVVRLQPSWQDKLSINMFVLNLTANAVTSERVDQDYMFHPHNRGPLTTLINNLRQSGFYWTSFTPEDIMKTIERGKKWLEEEEHCTVDYEKDRKLLQQAIQHGEVALASRSWRALSDYHEMGIYVHDFPEVARDTWSLVPEPEGTATLVGALPLAEAQRNVKSQILLHNPNPTDCLAGCGIHVMRKMQNETTHMAKSAAALPKRPKVEGMTMSGNFGENQLGGSAFGSANRKAKLFGKQTRFAEKKASVPGKRRRKNIMVAPSVIETSSTKHQRISEEIPSQILDPQPQAHGYTSAASLSQTRNEISSYIVESIGKPLVPRISHAQQMTAPSPLTPNTESVSPTLTSSNIPSTTITGTSSAKLSYLLSRLIALYPHEKSLIFYDFDNIAFYTAQALDLLSIPYLIYTGSLNTKLKNDYIQSFNTDSYFRVLLMDLKQAAHGLHIASASRVFFVNPVWQPSIEAQAIKRAHRIGQKREVFVETLVLKGTLEEDLWKRRRGMSEGERRLAEKSMLDDPVMWDAIKKAKFLEIENAEEGDVERQMAKLEIPQRVFGRGIEEELSKVGEVKHYLGAGKGLADGQPARKRRRKSDFNHYEQQLASSPERLDNSGLEALNAQPISSTPAAAAQQSPPTPFPSVFGNGDNAITNSATSSSSQAALSSIDAPPPLTKKRVAFA